MFGLLALPLSAETAGQRLARIRRERGYTQVELAQLEVAGIGQVTRRAIQEALSTNLTRKQAENLAPDGAEQYALLAWQGVFGMARRIDALDAGW